MLARPFLYHDILTTIHHLTRPTALRATAVTRLALLVTGILAAQTGVVRTVAKRLLALELTAATTAESIERRIRRTLSDARLSPERAYQPVLAAVLDWSRLWRAGRRVTLVVDESSQDEHVHLFRLGIALWGLVLPVAWAVWPQNTKLGDGVYWRHLDRVLASTARLLPVDLQIDLLADRAFDVVNFVQRVAALGWSWTIRAKARSDLRLRDQTGREFALKTVVAHRLPRPGTHFQHRRLDAFAGVWLPVSVTGVWTVGQQEPLVVLCSRGNPAEPVNAYRHRSWIEASFRADKSHGWEWEASGVHTVAHTDRLLVALAWATLIALCFGLEEAERRLLAVRTVSRAKPPKPQPVRDSLFTLGRDRIAAGFLGQVCPLSWRLDLGSDEAWSRVWRHEVGYQFVVGRARP